MARRFIEWDVLEFRVNGAKIASIAGEQIHARDLPISELFLTFNDGLLKIEGKIRKLIGIPFVIEIDELIPSGKSLRIPFRRVSAFGIPLPSFLMTVAQLFLDSDEVSYDSSTNALTIMLDRFLPPFADVEIVSVRPVAGGIAVRLGAGGADLPQTSGGRNGEPHA